MEVDACERMVNEEGRWQGGGAPNVPIGPGAIPLSTKVTKSMTHIHRQPHHQGLYWNDANRHH